MSKFNSKAEDTSITNYMGAKAFKQSPKEELAMTVLTTFIENSYYRSKDVILDRTKELVKEVAAKDPEFVAKLAIYARNKFNMRSSSQVIMAELAKHHRGDSLVKTALQKVIERPDDAVEIVAYLGKKSLPNQVKKGISVALNKFDAHQIGKYKSKGKEFNMLDIMRLCHVKPTKETEHIWKKLVNGELKNIDTWESKLSAGESHEKVWKDLLTNKKLGFMAALRNLRSILGTNDGETIKLAAQYISNRTAVKNSKQLPFRFLSAYEEVFVKDDSAIKFEKDGYHSKLITEAIEAAVEYSVANIPLLNGRTLILSDNSGSMRGDSGGDSLVSVRSKRTTSDIANLFAVLYWLRCDNTLVGLFGDKLVHPKLDREKKVFENFKIINEEAYKCGYRTEQGIFEMFEKLLNDNVKVDRIVIFSDQQVGRGCEWYDKKHRTGSDFNALLQKYRKFCPECKIYSIDLRNCGNRLVSDGVYLLSGWSDQIFQVMELFETDKHAFLNSIESVDIYGNETVKEEVNEQ